MTSANLSDSDPDAYSWEVQDILAERTVKGDREVLVIWKPTWIAVNQLDKDGPVYQAWKGTPKMSKAILIRYEGTVSHALPTETPITTAIIPEQSPDQSKRGKKDD